jgi:DNA-binding NarL/FixJ family response regulator
VEILQLAADGLTNRQIGERLYLAEKTIKHHFSGIGGWAGIFRRLGALNRANAVAIGLRQGLIH